MTSKRFISCPSLAARQPINRARRGQIDTKTVIIIILAVVGCGMLLVCGVLVALLLPRVQQARQTARNVQSRNNLKQIGLAMHNYHDVYQQFPPAGIYGEDGTAYHSWQAMLLPYVDEAPLYNTIDFNVPWTDLANAGKFQFPVQAYLNPAIMERTDSSGFALSHYAGNSQVLHPNGNLGLLDFKDGTSNTILAGEVAAGFKPWGDPGNVRDPADGLLHDANTFGTVNAPRTTVEFLLGDGSVRSISTNIDPDVLKALATPDGGEQIPPGSF